jgi:nitrate reductase gamma subunit
MGVVLAIFLYVAYVIFLGRIGWRFYLLARAGSCNSGEPGKKRRKRVRALLNAALDIFFLLKLFKSNRWLWLGEWLFHAAFVFVIIRHMRFIMDPVPGWLISYQNFGICSGYLLAGSLLCILAYKVFSERRRYISSYNLFILSLLLVVSLTGLLMRIVFRPDVASVKYFMQGAVTFNPAPPPESMTFIIHYLTALIFFIFLPSHIFSAPYTLMEARKREEALHLVMHE